jgi:predicted amidophosphoribosyltransferase
MVQTVFGILDRTARKVGQSVFDWVARFVEQCRSCRECHKRVAFLEEICPHCGIRTPAKVSLTTSATVAAVFVLGLVFLVCL